MAIFMGTLAVLGCILGGSDYTLITGARAVTHTHLSHTHIHTHTYTHTYTHTHMHRSHTLINMQTHKHTHGCEWKHMQTQMTHPCVPSLTPPTPEIPTNQPLSLPQNGCSLVIQETARHLARVHIRKSFIYMVYRGPWLSLSVERERALCWTLLDCLET